MPDPSMERNKQLKRIADATERQIKLMEVLNKNIVQLGVHAVPVMESVHKLLSFLEGTDEENPVSTGQMKLDENSNDVDFHWDCTQKQCQVAIKDPDFDYEDCPKVVNPDGA